MKIILKNFLSHIFSLDTYVSYVSDEKFLLVRSKNEVFLFFQQISVGHVRNVHVRRDYMCITLFQIFMTYVIELTEKTFDQ